MAEQNISIDYTSRDFESIEDDLIRTAQIILPEWTDLSESDPGRVFLTLFAGIADKLHFYIDRMASESFIGTAIKRESIIKILKLINYELDGPLSAQTIVEFSLSEPFANEDIEVPEQTELQTQANSPVIFETDDDVVLSATSLIKDSEGTDTIDVNSTAGFSEGEEVFVNSDSNNPIRRVIDSIFPETDIIQFTDDVPSGYNVSDNAYIEETSVSVEVVQGETKSTTIGESNGEPNQEFLLTNKRVVENSDVLFVDDGSPEIWFEVEFLGSNSATDDIYTSERTPQDNLRYSFGDGKNGNIPSNGADIIVSYRVGRGSEGNVGSDKITTLNDNINVSGQTVPFSVTNPEPAVGGREAETKEEARRQGPREFRTLNRAVSDQDFVILSEGFPGISAAKAEADGFTEKVYAVVENEDERSESAQLIKDDLQDFLAERSIGSMSVEVIDPEFIEILTGGEIIYESNNNESDIVESVRNEVDSFFDIGSNITGFQSNIFVSDLIERLDNLTGVNHVNLDRLSFDPESTITREVWGDSDTEFSSIELLDNSVRARYEIEFSSSDTSDFSVTKHTVENGEEIEVVIDNNVASDDNDGIGHLDEVYEIKNEVRFLLSSGTVPNQRGDVISFKTSQFKSNLVFQDNEFPVQGSTLFEYISLDEKLQER